MGRRKKESKGVHRQSISAAAQDLFMSRGIEATSMDEIAKAAGYSKATLYVYFKEKAEIVGMLTLESMKKLDDYISSALTEQADAKGRYNAICQGLLAYRDEFPFYFRAVLEEINIDFTAAGSLPEEEETFRIGEEISAKIKRFLEEGIASGELRADIPIPAATFAFWGMLSGLIQTAVNKEAYLRRELGLSRQEFLAYGFETLYRSVAATKEEI